MEHYQKERMLGDRGAFTQRRERLNQRIQGHAPVTTFSSVGGRMWKAKLKKARKCTRKPKKSVIVEKRRRFDGEEERVAVVCERAVNFLPV